MAHYESDPQRRSLSSPVLLISTITSAPPTNSPSTYSCKQKQIRRGGGGGQPDAASSHICNLPSRQRNAAVTLW